MALIKLNTRSIPDNAVTPAKVVQEGRKNLLINGGFEISQRGTYTSAASYNDGTYLIDRWETLRDGVTANYQHLVPVSGESSYGFKLIATSSAAGAIRLRQRLEIPNIYKWGARTFTLSARVKSNSSNARLMMYGGSGGGYVAMTSDSNDSHTGGGAIETLTATFTTTGSVSSEFAAFVGIDNARSASDPTIASGDYFEVYDFQMEEGSHASSFENRTPPEELALCQRYYYQVGGTSGFAQIAPCIGTSTTELAMQVKFPVDMRQTPSVSWATNNNLTFRRMNNGSHDWAPNSVAALTTGELRNYGGAIWFGGFSHGQSTYAAGHVRVSNGSNHLRFDAEL